MSKQSFELLIFLDSKGELKIISSSPFDSNKFMEFILPFINYPGCRERLLNGERIKLKAEFKDGELQRYSVGFSKSLRVSQEVSYMSIGSG